MTKVAPAVFLTLLCAVTASGESPEAASPTLGDAFSFVSDVTIPDGTPMGPGQSFTKTWRIRNSGSTTWNGYSLAFVEGAQMDAPSFVSVARTPPGATVDISVPMRAPMAGGYHKGWWAMRDASGEFFTDKWGKFFVLIRVESSEYEGRSFEDWEADLEADSSDVRKKAIQALRQFGHEAIPALITAVDDDDESVRSAAIGALAEITPPTYESMRVLLERMIEPEGIEAMVLYGYFAYAVGPEAVPALVEVATREANTEIRGGAIGTLARLGPAAKEAVPALRELADQDRDAEVREIAEEALQQIGGGAPAEDAVGPRPVSANPAASEQESPYSEPAPQGTCDVLLGATEGLHELCVAVCETEDCRFEDFKSKRCQPSKHTLLVKYNEMRYSRDPDMPCVQDPCPCWSCEELEGIPFDPHAATWCIQRSDVANLTSDGGSHNGRRLIQQVSASVSGRGYTCRYTDSMKYPERESGRPPSLTELEFAICRSQIEERCSTLALDQVEVTSGQEDERDAKESEALAADEERLKEGLRRLLRDAEPPRP